MQQEVIILKGAPIRKLSLPGYQSDKPDTYQVNGTDKSLIQFDEKFFELTGKVKYNIYATDGVALYLWKEIIDSPAQIEYDLPQSVLDFREKSRRPAPTHEQKSGRFLRQDSEDGRIIL